MKWTRGHESSFVVDRRGGGRIAGGLGIGGMLIAIVLSMIFGVDLTGLFSGGGAGGGEPIPADKDRDLELKQFTGFVLDDAQATWAKLEPDYRPAHLVLFTDAVQTRCGYADAGVGPFYCSGDEQVYIDLSFFRVLDSKFGAPGDFAQAYVIAHEIGHHVQNVKGVFDRTARETRRDPSRKNELSVRQELQADCYAGVWAHHTGKRDLLEEGDIEEGLGAASAVGDDTLQERAKGHVEPETFTHGSAKQRMKWFRVGYDSGKPEDCDTFSVGSP
jgi:predicted metalloprotease